MRRNSAGLWLAVTLAAMIWAHHSQASDVSSGRTCPEVEGAVFVALPDGTVAGDWSWVAERMGLGRDAPAPSVCIVGGVPLAAIRARAEGTAPNSFEILGLYDADAGAVLLARSWSGRSTAARSVVIHELTHHAQALLNRRYSCQAEAEAEAFQVQEDWLYRRGETLEGAIGLDPLARILLSNCAW